MPVKIEYLDSASPWLEWAAKEYPNYATRALKSAGYWVSQEIKKGIKSGAPGGQRYAPTLPTHTRQLIDMAFGKKEKKDYPILGRLRNAIGYEYEKNNNAVRVGWLSISAVRLGKRLEDGFTTKVTAKMRKALAAVGLGMSGKSFFRAPPRPTIEPMYNALHKRIAPYMEEKIWQYINGAGGGPAKTRRKYLVKGDFW